VPDIGTGESTDIDHRRDGLTLDVRAPRSSSFMISAGGVKALGVLAIPSASIALGLANARKKKNSPRVKALSQLDVPLRDLGAAEQAFKLSYPGVWRGQAEGLCGPKKSSRELKTGTR